MTHFVVSDTHFGHERILGFRPEFSSVAAMDEQLVANWNATVGDGDTVYHLGDVCLHRRHLAVIRTLAGRKILIRGNHDLFPVRHYLEAGFKDVRGYIIVEATDGHRGAILSHIPLHPSQLGFFGLNIHGHLHDKALHDPLYVNVSVEMTGYAPVPLESLLRPVS